MPPRTRFKQHRPSSTTKSTRPELAPKSSLHLFEGGRCPRCGRRLLNPLVFRSCPDAPAVALYAEYRRSDRRTWGRPSASAVRRFWPAQSAIASRAGSTGRVYQVLLALFPAIALLFRSTACSRTPRNYSPYPPDVAAVRLGAGAARASRMTASAVRPARRPVATTEQRSA
jgi:hypothetical protein